LPSPNTPPGAAEQQARGVSLLFVCLGNICRSPTAEGVMRELVRREGLQEWITLDSAGTGGWHVGDPPDARATSTAHARGIELEGAEAVVVGRSKLVGVPVARLLLAANATVTVCHSRTRDLAGTCARADVLVAAVGVPRLLGGDAVKEGAVVIDVGVNRTDEGLRGDVDPSVAERAGLLTPVPGGVGPMTIAMLVANTVKACRQQSSR